MSTNSAVATTDRGITRWVEEPKLVSRLQAALGDIMPVEQFTAHMLTAFQDSKIIACSDQSKFIAVHKCAALGLLPTLDQVRLIPYGNEVKAMVQWQGYKALMERHPDVLDVTGYLVHVSDQITVENGEPNHRFNPLQPGREFKSVADLQGGYCKIIYCNARPPKYHCVTARQITKAQACAQTQNIWKKWYEQMALKTLYRDCYARRAVPIDPCAQVRLQKAILSDDRLLGNDPQRVPIESPTEPDQLAALLSPVAPEPQEPPPDHSEKADLPETLQADNAVDTDADQAQLLAEYQETIGSAERVEAIIEVEDHAKANGALTEKAKQVVFAWCKQQVAVIRKAEKRLKA